MKVSVHEKTSRCCDLCLERNLLSFEKALKSCENVKVNSFAQSVDNRVMPIVYRVTIEAECKGGFSKVRKFIVNG